MDKMTCIVDGYHGVYVPQMFLRKFDYKEWNVKRVDALELGSPGNEFYWETWDAVLNNATFIDTRRHTWRLHSGDSGDLFAVDCGLHDEWPDLEEEEK